MNELHRHILVSPLNALSAEARRIRSSSGRYRMTYSRKVFVPLSQLCRNVCHYCTFAKSPKRVDSPYMTIDQVLAVARSGAIAGCKEALFTLGDKPEERYASAREALERLGYSSTTDYLYEAAGKVHSETGLIPHINAGVMTRDEFRRLRAVSGSMGLMLESASERLSMRGGPHFGSPDKTPAARIAAIAAAGEAEIPFTSGILIGIGETREERLESLQVLNDLHSRYGHIQEVIIQNFRAKPDTLMANAPEPSEEELLWTVAAARLILDPDIGIQTPPNLNVGRTAALIDAGLDDWGGISPVTIDHVNPEAPWPEIGALATECAGAGLSLVERLTVWPRYMVRPERWLEPGMRTAIRKLADSEGLARDSAWSPGTDARVPGTFEQPLGTSWAGHIGGRSEVEPIISRAFRGETLEPREIVTLLSARGGSAEAVVGAADTLRREVNGDIVTYVVNRNINYTNLCTFHCSFCAFSKAPRRSGTRDVPYNLSLDEIANRAREAHDKGATEVCLQGGIHPSYTGETYLSILRAVKDAVPEIHVHAFSPLEIHHGATTLGLSVSDYLARMRDAGLGSLPGTAAEILDDEIRKVICPDKLDSRSWLEIVRAAHEVGLRTTATIMFGHVDRLDNWARHILAIRALQMDTGGFTEFVPLPFVHMQSPMFLRGQSRMGPTWRETVLMHAVSRLALHRAIGSIQASWVKLGVEGAAACLGAGVNDLGGLLMNESISRAAGASHGQEVDAAMLRSTAQSAGRTLRQRTTLYQNVPSRSAMGNFSELPIELQLSA
ncbi:MAG: 5-amino-6-(D-ribitylamino)uracil--L-tyrosine 4-hydroxyphenyl transferase CofH [Sphingosinicella sp.]|nr:5-amino-6-(D-ribitylamino)uracil--L-tyrosine 4-hydroxyphenyl transferase CofH [Sphingosinicella sp.]